MNLDGFIKKYAGLAGGGERGTYQMFLTELCQVLGVDAPDPKGQGLGDYEFEAPVRSEAAFGRKGTHRIDLYKRNCFILEAKQTQLKPGETMAPEPEAEPLTPIYDLFGNPVGYEKLGKPAARYDKHMADARLQAERYALGLPADHKSPPFLIVADLGRSFELYFDWAGNGRGYSFFPDQQSYRITLDALGGTDKIGSTGLTALELLRAIWTDPASADPRLKAAEVTRDIAQRLARVAEDLEKAERARNPDKTDVDLVLQIEETSLFLMRLLFCMFAEDVELLPGGSFTQFLTEAKDKSDQWWRSGLHDLWAKMNAAEELNRFWPYGDAVIRHFNGNLFASAKVYDLPPEMKGELRIAAQRDWRAVEPAIFGTLLEQVLTATERAKLGAHYTPRPYVQRLVSATISEVLDAEWAEVRDAARAQADAGDIAAALAGIGAFHDRLAALRILDPACGTGNFLYVAMEALLRLENDVLQLAAELGSPLPPRIHPNQFLGLELNPRAAVIAELVLWIGWLRHRLANHPQAIGDPVLPTLTNINNGTHGGMDAVLRLGPDGVADTANPMVPDWPEADFIVGNPPFIGGKDIRAQLGGDYAEALWKANPRVPPSADFVMQWWDRAALILTRPASRLRRFGFVTTNSITQTFSRRVIERYLTKSSPSGGGGSPSGLTEGQRAGEPDEGQHDPASPPPSLRDGPPPLAGEELGLSLILAIPDHPWTKATKDAAAVRIAMTVAERGEAEGRLVRITREADLDKDVPRLVESGAQGRINADLSLGADVTAVRPLLANHGLASPGVKLHGAGFIVTPQEAEHLGLGRREGLDEHIRPYRNGRDLLQRSRGVMVIDLFGLTEKEVRQRYPEVYQHLDKSIRTQREEQASKSPTNDANAYARTWWLHGKPRQELRPALLAMGRYIATVETSKHRIFLYLDASILPDNMLIAIGSDSPFHLGVLTSRIHCEWTLRVGGWLGMGNDNRYNKSKVFDPFPFPDATPEQRAVIGELAEELDATRKQALAETPNLTMTELYNLRDMLRSGQSLTPQQQERATAARAGIVHRLHEQIDAAVADAYGWPADLAPQEIVTRLVALNAERAAEEKAGHIRWLRPDYQIPRFAPKG